MLKDWTSSSGCRELALPSNLDSTVAALKIVSLLRATWYLRVLAEEVVARSEASTNSAPTELESEAELYPGAPESAVALGLAHDFEGGCQIYSQG